MCLRRTAPHTAPHTAPPPDPRQIFDPAFLSDGILNDIINALDDEDQHVLQPFMSLQPVEPLKSFKLVPSSVPASVNSGGVVKTKIKKEMMSVASAPPDSKKRRMSVASAPDSKKKVETPPQRQALHGLASANVPKPAKVKKSASSKPSACTCGLAKKWALLAGMFEEM